MFRWTSLRAGLVVDKRATLQATTRPQPSIRKAARLAQVMALLNKETRKEFLNSSSKYPCCFYPISVARNPSSYKATLALTRLEQFRSPATLKSCLVRASPAGILQMAIR